MKTPKNAYFSDFDPISATFSANIIPYPIGNSSGNSMVPFSKSQNYVICLYDVIITSKIAIFGPFSPQLAYLSTIDHITVTFDTNVIPYPIGNLPGNPMVPFLNSQNNFFLDI